jgi:hypothetical protein
MNPPDHIKLIYLNDTNRVFFHSSEGLQHVEVGHKLVYVEWGYGRSFSRSIPNPRMRHLVEVVGITASGQIKLSNGARFTARLDEIGEKYHPARLENYDPDYEQALQDVYNQAHVKHALITKISQVNFSALDITTLQAILQLTQHPVEVV